MGRVEIVTEHKTWKGSLQPDCKKTEYHSKNFGAFYVDNGKYWRFYRMKVLDNLENDLISLLSKINWKVVWQIDWNEVEQSKSRIQRNINYLGTTIMTETMKGREAEKRALTVVEIVLGN